MMRGNQGYLRIEIAGSSLLLFLLKVYYSYKFAFDYKYAQWCNILKFLPTV